MEIKNIVLNSERNVTLTAYLQPIGGEFGEMKKRPAILILPGGGYSMCSDREAEPVAFVYLKAGYQVFILRYSVGKNAIWPTPLKDYEAAMSLIREKEEEWHIQKDSVAVIGFSAGGHLAAAAATMSVNRPDAAILGYPVIEGESAKVWEKTAPDLVQAVDYKTCPCFIFATRTDNMVSVQNSIHFMDALNKCEVAFESHIYSNGPHGFSICDSSVQGGLSQFCSRVPHWVEDSIEWLKDVLGYFEDGLWKAPRFGRKLNGNHDKILNIDCTMSYLMSIPSSAEIIGSMMQGTRTEKQEEQINTMTEGMDTEALQAMISNMTLRQTLEAVNVPEEILMQLDEQLHQIENKAVSELK